MDRRPRVHLTFPPPDGVRRLLAEETWEVTWSATPTRSHAEEVAARAGGANAWLSSRSTTSGRCCPEQPR